MVGSVITLTTVGYGDIVLVTYAGHLLGGAIALPTGILSGALMEELDGNGKKKKPKKKCSHCGKER